MGEKTENYVTRKIEEGCREPTTICFICKVY